MKQFDTTRDYYELLGVKPDAGREQIDREFRNRARLSHPDTGGAEEDMKLLNEARDVLTDPEARQAYDEQRRLRIESTVPYGSSLAYDPGMPAHARPLKIPVSDADIAGLLMGASACIGLGVPFLILIEMQYVFFLWPLRFLTIGMIGVGVLMAHAALKAKHRHWKKNAANREARSDADGGANSIRGHRDGEPVNEARSKGRDWGTLVREKFVLQELLFWSTFLSLAAGIYILLYAT